MNFSVDTNSLLIGIASSVIAAIVIGTVVTLWRRSRAITVNYLVLRASRIGIDRYYPDRKIFLEGFQKENQGTKKLKVMTNRGVPFVDPSYHGAPIVNWPKLGNIQFLLIDPNSGAAMLRGQEIAGITKRDFRVEDFQRDIENSVRRLEKIEGVQLKLHDEPSVFRIIVTDRYAYLSGFPSDDFGESAPVYRTPQGAFLYKICEKYFDSIWRISKDSKGLSDKFPAG